MPSHMTDEFLSDEIAAAKQCEKQFPGTIRNLIAAQGGQTLDAYKWWENRVASRN